MDKQTLKQLDDLDAMRQASRMYYQTLVAEKIGITTLRAAGVKIRRRTDNEARR